MIKTDWREKLSDIQDNYSWDAKQFWGFIENRELDFESVRDYIDQLFSQEYAGNTIHKRVAMIKNRLVKLRDYFPAVLNAEEWLRIESFLRVKLKECNKKIIKINKEDQLTSLEINDLVAGCKKGRLQMIIRFLASEGLGISEAINIKISDISNSNDYSVIRIRGRNSKNREIKISNNFLEEITQCFHGANWLLETASGRKYRRESIGWQIAEKGMIVLGKKISPHTLRHSFAFIHLLEKKTPLGIISTYLGHYDPKVTAEMYLPEPTRWCRDVLDNIDVDDYSQPKETRESSPISNKGFVYLLIYPEHIKIGHSETEKRPERLSGVLLPERATDICYFKTDDMIRDEKYLHEKYKIKRKNGEWFDLTTDEIDEIKKYFINPIRVTVPE